MIAKEAIEILKANYPDACYEQLREAVDVAIEALKAQEAAGDTISRQAAIDEITEYGSRDTIYMSVAELKRRIEHLPPTHPETIKCRDCMHGVDYYHDGDCYCSNPKWGLMYFGGSWEFYCADAERITNETQT